MKNAIQISIEKPCTKKFNNFSITKKGGFCNACKKEVIDFTTMNEFELIKVLTDGSDKICGKFKSSQLKNYEKNALTMIHTNSISKRFGIMGLSLFAFCATSNSQAQELASLETTVQTEIRIDNRLTTTETIVIDQHTITGTVLDEENVPLPGVNVVLKGTSEGVITDIDGKFEFPSALDVGDILIFSYIGYETKQYKVTESNSETVDIKITFDSYDVELMGEVVIDGPYKTKRGIFHKLTSAFKK
ncbi:carboxypeptidase-like regulatory domain-containing protein [Aurantibacter crassamenti]|uniref:carboxypeptidase-like regulatory domain-containing protein n=1 Tax=Aurantibacter crassamenti TaxID=1837375 RepID=UPI00193A790D|nr:carboxypeptidase-like regulatory domain-containing protein [Aurantibacter crassamenti]MBM1106089.1 carboxypeptidase-like regulatory domain-containing protein [Aurantibacter crassamenti]